MPSGAVHPNTEKASCGEAAVHISRHEGKDCGSAANKSSVVILALGALRSILT
jgi:hypothetical protein